MSEFTHYKLWKPYGYLSQFINNQNRRKNKKLLSDLVDLETDIMSIGRLDEKSEGLLLLTNNGKLSQLIRGRKVEKEYWVKVDGVIDQAAVKQLQQGVDISIYGKTYRTLACDATLIKNEPIFPTHQKPRDPKHGPTSWITITLREGKFHQVRKMTAAVGFPCLRLIRTRIGNETLDGLQPGKYLPVDEFDIGV